MATFEGPKVKVSPLHFVLHSSVYADTNLQLPF